jgi:hypothetical protein
MDWYTSESLRSSKLVYAIERDKVCMLIEDQIARNKKTRLYFLFKLIKLLIILLKGTQI